MLTCKNRNQTNGVLLLIGIFFFWRHLLRLFLSSKLLHAHTFIITSPNHFDYYFSKTCYNWGDLPNCFNVLIHINCYHSYRWVRFCIIFSIHFSPRKSNALYLRMVVEREYLILEDPQKRTKQIIFIALYLRHLLYHLSQLLVQHNINNSMNTFTCTILQ